ncbi:MAG: hypothetical protein HYY26_06575 [Acidobacteria bacterium]|nr:hypothetical protein [Acidobacteriota bacterium]
MRRSHKLALVLAVPALAGLLAACPQRVTIAKIKQDPGRYHDKEVVLRGQVTQSFGALDQGIYEIDDGTGRLWVLVEDGGVPRKGAEVETLGRVVPGISFQGRDYGTSLREKKHRLR